MLKQIGDELTVAPVVVIPDVDSKMASVSEMVSVSESFSSS